jgi:4-hydroxy-tetrahydrodipicolinate reductase
MRFGIVGSGKMAHEIESLAPQRGHEVVWKLGSAENREGKGLTPGRVSGADVIFEFTVPSAVKPNLRALAAANAKVVCGTTGWSHDVNEVSRAFEAGSGALVYASNFSVGVHLFWDLVARASALYPPAGYAAYLTEEHHAGKRDAPSGTARTIATIFEGKAGRALPVTSVRAGTVPGTHRLVFESQEDEVEMIHRARGRAGFARGAVWAGERVAGRTGVFEFADLLKELPGFVER